jgi:hypothetical protein
MCGANTYYEASSKIILFLFAGTDALGWEKLCTEFSPPSARSSKLCINSTDYSETFTSVIIEDFKGHFKCGENMNITF